MQQYQWRLSSSSGTRGRSAAARTKGRGMSWALLGIWLTIAPAFALSGCGSGNAAGNRATGSSTTPPALQPSPAATAATITNPGKVIHVLVALCDNQYQGIVPVPPRIGNGDDPANNLYWGAGYGVKSFFKKAADWTAVSNGPGTTPAVLERIAFKHKQKNVYLVADAYRGREIKQCTIDFLEFAAGKGGEVIDLSAGAQRVSLRIGGGADLIAYVGHDGLMDFSISNPPEAVDQRKREVMILACASKAYFRDSVRRTGADPLLWTTGLMAPEAYVLKGGIDGWVLGEDGEQVRRRAAEAYNRYQRCGIGAASRLFSSGW
ncbi:MAG TPA: hypothetical protein VFV34_22950 [Blastocatellia bacterium]|nr:hypothetical protein [Blastocatellia bacterium]